MPRAKDLVNQPVPGVRSRPTPFVLPLLHKEYIRGTITTEMIPNNRVADVETVEAIGHGETDRRDVEVRTETIVEEQEEEMVNPQMDGNVGNRCQ